MSDEKIYSEQDVAEKITQSGLSEWYLEEGWLRRKIATDGWQTTLQVVNVVGFLCEAAYHHADLAVTYAKVWINLMTHSEGGITDKDFALAKKIEEVVYWRPEEGSVFEGKPNKFLKQK